VVLAIALQISHQQYRHWKPNDVINKSSVNTVQTKKNALTLWSRM